MKLRNVILSTMLIMIIFMSVVSAADRVSLGFLYGISNPTELVDRTNGAMNQVAPTCLNLTTTGNLIVTSELTHQFVEEMHAREILVTPFLSNHWVRSKGRAAIKNADKLANDIVNVIAEYNLDGINVDIENLTSEDRDAFSEFVRVLREKMPEDKILSVCVAANPEASEKGWQGSYDYAKLGEFSDYLFVMTYDEHSQGGACGPVSSLTFVEKSIQYALQYVSKDKIVIGIPFYGRYWKEGAETGGEAVVIGAIPALVSKNKAVVKYDETIGEASVTFSIYADGVKSKINGVELEEGIYHIWYPNEASIKAKLDLVNQYDLLGAGVWALGQEKVDVWSYYKEELNRIPYISLEEEKMQQEREKYEALVIDLSNLEEPDLFPFQNEMRDEFTEEEWEKVKVQEKTEHILEKVIELPKKFETSETLGTILKVKKETKKERKNQLKKVHIYRYCRKELLR